MIQLFINEVVEIQELAAKEKGLYLRNEIEKRVVNIPFDVDKMHQVLSNLISNAIKFTETGGITVSCINCEKDNCVKISIRDTGQGIKQEDMGKLWGFVRKVEIGTMSLRKLKGAAYGRKNR